MEDKSTKMLTFIEFLLNNDNIKNEPLISAETNIVNFISKNRNGLEKTLSSPQFFPGSGITETLELLLTTLREKVLNDIKPILYKHIGNLNFNVLNEVKGSESIAQEFLKEKLIQFLDIILTHKEVRHNFNAVMHILTYNILDKYIVEIFDRKEFIYNELIKVQRVKFTADQYINYLKALLFIKNSAYIKITFPLGTDTKNLNYSDIQKVSNIKVIEKFFSAITEFNSKSLPGLNTNIILMALKSNCRQEFTKLEEASARLLYALTLRFQEYKHIDKIDRGAESPDKSWFNIARKNTEFQGLNKSLIEELYKIAADNNW